MTNTKKDRKQKKIYGDIEALADARRALKKEYLEIGDLQVGTSGPSYLAATSFF